MRAIDTPDGLTLDDLLDAIDLMEGGSQPSIHEALGFAKGTIHSAMRAA